MAELLNDILQKVSAFDLTSKALDARSWLHQTIAKIATPSPTKLINHAESRVEQTMTRSSIGRMYLFGYDAKTKKKLPYWDAFPLIIPFRVVPDGFYGLNIHYLPPLLRAKLLDGMGGLLNNKKFDDSTRFRLTYQTLQQVSRVPYYEPCVKRYLNTQLKTPFMYIPPDKWAVAMFLPLARFQGATEQRVFADSTKGL